MIETLAFLAFLAGLVLLGWACWLWWQHWRWRRKLAGTRALLERTGGLEVEEWPVTAILFRRSDQRIRRGRAALFLTDKDLWIEVDHPQRGVCIQRRVLLRAGTASSLAGETLRAPVLYLAWRQEPDGVVEGGFFVSNPRLWAERLSQLGAEEI